eukprot:m.293610 g.293610  ORF g.293610 m.293610 type:complete len:62 (+) comp19493_c2_seq3:1007-1192(+)
MHLFFFVFLLRVGVLLRVCGLLRVCLCLRLCGPRTFPPVSLFFPQTLPLLDPWRNTHCALS